MTKAWIQASFADRGSNQVAVYTEQNGEIVCDADWLATTTGTATKYADLSALSIASQGWQKIFDQWKANGIVS